MEGVLGEIAKLGASLAAILFLALMARRLDLGGDIRIRDEAHRFAITFHRQQRLKTSRRSRLDEIPGLGFQRQKQLLAHFHSVDYIREASVQQLQEVSGIGEQLAKEIYDYFHPA